MTLTVFRLVPIRQLLSGEINIGFHEKAIFQSVDSKQEKANFCGKDDSEYVRTNM
jgi:hypothetical protein